MCFYWWKFGWLEDSVERVVYGSENRDEVSQELLALMLHVKERNIEEFGG
jgi:hypothetical protein